MDANESALSLLSRAVGLPGSTFDFPYEQGFSAVTPPMIELYRAGRLMRAELRLGLVDGDLKRSSRELAVLDQLTAALARESFLISVLIHLGVERELLAAIRDIVETGVDDPDWLTELEGRLFDHDCAETLRRGIGGEAAAVLSATGLRRTDDDSSGRLERLVPWFLEPYQLAALLDTYLEMVRSLDKPFVEILENQRLDSTDSRWSYQQLMLPNLLESVDKVKATELSRVLASRALELRLMELATGRYPAALEISIQDPYAAGSIEYGPQTDGAATLSAPDAIEL